MLGKENQKTLVVLNEQGTVILQVLRQQINIDGIDSDVKDITLRRIELCAGCKYLKRGLWNGVEEYHCVGMDCGKTYKQVVTDKDKHCKHKMW